MNFPSIPVKVTINEYLDLSKDYSTPKSNSFINGILDKILGDLKRTNSIKKIGRGLIEEKKKHINEEDLFTCICSSFISCLPTNKTYSSY
ncbi:transcription antitermination protein NusB [Pedobacter sp. NJ-S-72]